MCSSSEGHTKQCVEVTNLVRDVRRAVVVIRVVVILLWQRWAFCQRGTWGRGSGVFQHVCTNEHEIRWVQMFEQRKLTGLLKEWACRKTQWTCSSLKLKHIWQRLCQICSCECYTVCLVILLGFSLQPLAKELLLFGQVLFYEAILAHLLTHL